MKSRFLLISLWLASFAVSGANADDGSATIQRDITFKTTEQGPLRLDLHFPAASKPAAGYPWVLFTHGGGWSAGDKTIAGRGVRAQGAQALLAAGFCVASVDYRLCTKEGKIRVRDCATDAKDALRFLAKHAAEYALDPQRVCTWGDSAGGHLAQLLLLSPPESFPGDPALAEAKYRLIAGVSWYGPCDLEKTELFIGPGQTSARDRFGPRIIEPGADESQRLAAYREVSPVNYLHADSPPLLMLQGEQDTSIPVQHARYMQQRAARVQAPVEIVIVQNAGHNWREAGGSLQPTLDEIMAKTAGFLKQRLAELPEN